MLLAASLLFAPGFATRAMAEAPDPLDVATAAPEESPVAAPPLPQPELTTPSPAAAPSEFPEIPAEPATAREAPAAVAAAAASNGDVTITVVQADADEDGARTAPTGTKFDYRLNIACAVLDGDCLTGGEVSIDLSAWRGYTVTRGGNTANVTSSTWNATTGILTLSLADIGAEGSSFTWDFSITTPAAVAASQPRDLAFTATVTGAEAEPVTSNEVSSHITAVVPESTVTKGVSRTTMYAGESVTWTVVESRHPTTGVELPASRVITDVIPEPLLFVSCTPASITTDWYSCTYDEATRTVTWIARGWPSSSSSTAGTVTTTVPAGTADGTRIENLATLTTKHGDGSTEIDTATAATTVLPRPAYPIGTASKTGSGGIGGSANTYIGNWKPDGTGVDSEGSYRVVASVTGDTAAGLVEVEIVDDVPCLTYRSGTFIYMSRKDVLCTAPAFYVTSVSLAPIGEPEPSAGWVPIAVLTDGTEVPLVANPARPVPAVMRWDVPAEAVGRVARIVAPRTDGDGIRILGNGEVHLILYGYAPDEVGLEAGNTLRNQQADLTMWRPGEDAAFATKRTNHYDINLIDTVYQGVYKYRAANGSTPNEWRQWGISALVQAPAALDGPYVTVTDLWPSDLPIPQDLLHVPTEWHASSGSVTDITGPVVWSGVPEVTYDLTATQHRLTWRIPVSVVNDALGSSASRVATLNAALPRTELLAPGKWTNRAVIQLSSADNPNATTMPEFRGTRSGVDPLDIDDDPATTGYTWYDRIEERSPVAGSAGFSLNKKVKGDQDQAFRVNPAVGTISAGDGTATYRLTWTNRGATSLKGSVLYDVFPYSGDTGLLSDNSATSRGSTFPVALTSVGALPAGVTVAYSTSTNPCRPEVRPDNPSCTDDWTTVPPADLSTVRALRWTNTTTYPFAGTWTVEFSVRVDQPIGGTDTAWNSVAGNATTADAFNSLLLPTEAPKVGIQIAPAAPLAWSKVDGDGSLLAGSSWQLTAVDGHGTPLTGSSAQQIDVTDNGERDLDAADGRLKIDGLLLGVRYRLVETVAPAGYLLDPTAVDITGADQYQAIQIVNRPAPVRIIVTKVVLDPDGIVDDDQTFDFQTSVDQAEFELADGETWTNEATAGTVATVAEGDLPTLPGGHWADPVYIVEGADNQADDQAEFEVPLGGPVRVTVTNTAIATPTPPPDPPAPPADPPGDGELPFTGAEALPVGLLGGSLVLAGGVAIVASRTRRRRT